MTEILLVLDLVEGEGVIVDDGAALMGASPDVMLVLVGVTGCSGLLFCLTIDLGGTSVEKDFLFLVLEGVERMPSSSPPPPIKPSTSSNSPNLSLLLFFLPPTPTPLEALRVIVFAMGTRTGSFSVPFTAS